MLFSQGSHFGGHALYVKDGRLHYVYNFVGMLEQLVVGTEDVPTGENLILSASFEKDGEDPPGISTGIVSLFHGDDKVGEGRIKTQAAAFGLSGTDLTVGRATSNVTDDFPGRAAMGVHRRHDPDRRGGRQRRSLRRPGARRRSHDRARMRCRAIRQRALLGTQLA